MELVWESGIAAPKTRKRTRQDKFARLAVNLLTDMRVFYHASIANDAKNDARTMRPLSPTPAMLKYTRQIVVQALRTVSPARPLNTEDASPSRQGIFRLSHTASTSSLEQRQTQWWNHQRFRPTQKPLPKHQQQYLDTVGAFLILPKSTTDILIPTYISAIDGLLPIIDGTQVLHDYHDGKASRYLIRAICLITCKTEQAAPFLKLDENGPVLDPLVFARTLYEGLDAAIGAELERDRIIQIQIRALMHLCTDGLSGTQRASAHLSQAIHDAWFMSLHYNVAGNTSQTRCDMLWWSLRCFDRLNRIMVGAPFMISDSDIQIARPIVSASYQSQILVVLTALGDLLVKVDEIYNPNVADSTRFIDDFPPFSEIVENVNFHALQNAHQNYLEIWYHVAAMLSCRSGSPHSAPYERRLKSADRIQEMMSHGRHAHLPPLPLIPYAIAMSLTVEYRALRENKRNIHESYDILKVRLEILEALGARWTTAKVMARLTRKALRFVKTEKAKNKTQKRSHRSTVRHKHNLQSTNQDVHEANSESYVRDLDSSQSSPQTTRSIVTADNDASFSVVEDCSTGSLEGGEEVFEWLSNYPHFNQGAIATYEFPNVGMFDIFNDPALWDVSPNIQ